MGKKYKYRKTFTYDGKQYAVYADGEKKKPSETKVSKDYIAEAEEARTV